MSSVCFIFFYFVMIKILLYMSVLLSIQCLQDGDFHLLIAWWIDDIETSRVLCFSIYNNPCAFLSCDEALLLTRDFIMDITLDKLRANMFYLSSSHVLLSWILLVSLCKLCCTYVQSIMEQNQNIDHDINNFWLLRSERSKCRNILIMQDHAF